MTDLKLMQQALEALDDVLQLSAEHSKVRSALRERLAQPEQEPVAWVGLTMDDMADLAVSKEWLAGARWAEAKLREKNA